MTSRSIRSLFLLLLVTIIAFSEAGALRAQAQNGGAPGPISVQKVDPEVVEIARTMGSLSREEFTNWLDTMERKSVPSEESRRQLITSYIQHRKLMVVGNGDYLYRITERARPALRLFRREGVVTFIVLSSPDPYIESLGGAFISMTTGLLRQIDSSDELNALVAHELAHEYNNASYEWASRRRNLKALRSYELNCDAVATLALKALRMKTRSLGEILFKIISWDTSILQVNDGTGRHPSLASRLRLNELLSDALKNQPDGADYSRSEPQS